VSVTSVSIYGGTLVLAYLVSALYHGIRHLPSKRVLQVIDHCTIYLLIAGTYTPIALLVLDDHAGWVLLAIVWSLALTGILLRTAWPHVLRKIGPSLYLILGWLGIAWAGPVIDRLGSTGVTLVLAGGAAYTLGVVFYLWDRLPFNQAVWHLFVATGSACFFSAIAFHALTAAAV
jgi:hemolysin III